MNVNLEENVVNTVSVFPVWCDDVGSADERAAEMKERESRVSSKREKQPKPLLGREPVSQLSGWSDGSVVGVTGARVADEAALKRLSWLLYANDDSIEDLIFLIENWERMSGRSLVSSSHGSSSLTSNEAMSEKADRVIRQRACQYKVMPTTLRQEPFVMILLALFINAIRGIKTSSKSACISSGCPDTTALRYLDKLEEEGMLVRAVSRSDRRVTEVELTDAGLELTRSLLIQDCC